MNHSSWVGYRGEEFPDRECLAVLLRTLVGVGTDPELVVNYELRVLRNFLFGKNYV